MTTPNMKRVISSKPAEFPGKAEAGAESQVRGSVPRLVQGPMSQQAALGSHGYDIHPQQFVRLVGCNEK